MLPRAGPAETSAITAILLRRRQAGTLTSCPPPRPVPREPIEALVNPAASQPRECSPVGTGCWQLWETVRWAGSGPPMTKF